MFVDVKNVCIFPLFFLFFQTLSFAYQQHISNLKLCQTTKKRIICGQLLIFSILGICFGIYQINNHNLHAMILRACSTTRLKIFNDLFGLVSNDFLVLLFKYNTCCLQWSLKMHGAKPYFHFNRSLFLKCLKNSKFARNIDLMASIVKWNDNQTKLIMNIFFCFSFT